MAWNLLANGRMEIDVEAGDLSVADAEPPVVDDLRFVHKLAAYDQIEIAHGLVIHDLTDFCGTRLRIEARIGVSLRGFAYPL